MNTYTITLTDDTSPPATITLSQQDIDSLLDRFALPAAVSAADAGNAPRTVVIGTLEVSHDHEPVWNGQIIDQEVFANMVGDALILNAVKYAEMVLAEREAASQEPRADN